MLKNFSGQILLSDKNKLKNPFKAIKKLERNSIFILRSNHKLSVSKLKKLRKLCLEEKVYFFVQELNLAYLLNADGISFKEKDLAKPRFQLQKKFATIISCHKQKSAICALKMKDDYILYSPIFNTTTHQDKKFLGRTRFNYQTRFLNINIIALGGLNKTNISLINNLNICGFAAIDYFVKFDREV